jgi:hypothetical protein
MPQPLLQTAIEWGGNIFEKIGSVLVLVLAPHKTWILHTLRSFCGATSLSCCTAVARCALKHFAQCVQSEKPGVSRFPLLWALALFALLC